MSEIAQLPREIQLLQQAASWLAECQDLDEIKKLRDQAAALRFYFSKQKNGEAAERAATIIKLRAERRIGEVSEELPKSAGGAGTHKGITSDNVSGVSTKGAALAAAGIAPKMANRCEASAALPEEQFEKTLNGTAKLTSNAMQKAGRRHQRETKRKEVIQSTPETGGSIITGDLGQLFDLVPDETADLFFTDPPYHDIHTSLFGRLAELAQAKLKPGGLCLVYSGQMFLPTVLTEMSSHMDYYWLFALRHTGGHLQIWNRKVWNDWKPILVFAKRPVQSASDHDWVQDFRDGGGRDKDYHEWGQDAQEATYWIEKLTNPGGLVIDPFAGGGAIPAACKATNRRWLATELDSSHAAIARSRVS